MDENDGVAGAGCCAKQTLGRTAESRSDEQAMKDWYDIDVTFKDW